MKLHQVLTGATNTFDDKAAIAVGSVDDHPFTVRCKLIYIKESPNNIDNVHNGNII